jgi:hypothetical protein
MAMLLFYIQQKYKNLKNEKAQFKAALRRYLNAHSFYSVDEFLMSTVNL